MTVRSFCKCGGTTTGLVAIELGHTDQEITFRHYRELVTPEAAEKYAEQNFLKRVFG